MTLLDAIGCPYCSGPLFKESYYFRCERDHRFTSSFQPAGSPGVFPGGDERQPTELPDGQRAPVSASAPGGTLLLCVLRHRDRREVGRVFTFTIGND